MNIGETYVHGQDGDTARALLAAAEERGYPSVVVRTSGEGFIVPDDVWDAAEANLRKAEVEALQDGVAPGQTADASPDGADVAAEHERAVARAAAADKARTTAEKPKRTRKRAAAKKAAANTKGKE